MSLVRSPVSSPVSACVSSATGSVDMQANLAVPADWVAPSSAWTIDAVIGTVEKTAANNSHFYLTQALDAGYYDISFDLTLTAATPILLMGSTTVQTLSSSGSFAFIAEAEQSDRVAILGNAARYTISNVVVRLKPGYAP